VPPGALKPFCLSSDVLVEACRNCCGATGELYRGREAMAVSEDRESIPSGASVIVRNGFYAGLEVPIDASWLVVEGKLPENGEGASSSSCEREG